jgi:hypothetical protein
VTTSHHAATRATEGATTSADVLASPPANRQPVARWRDLRLWLGALLVLVSMVVGAKVLSAAHHEQTVWELTRDVPAGVRLTTDDLRPTQVHFADSALAARYLPASQRLGPGSYASRDLTAGEMLTRAAVGNRSSSAVRQLPLGVPAAGLPVGLQVGDRVDVWALPDTSDGTTLASTDRPTRPALILRNVTVLSLGPIEAGLTADRQLLVAVSDSTDIGTVLSKLNGAALVLVRRG